MKNILTFKNFNNDYLFESIDLSNPGNASLDEIMKSIGIEITPSTGSYNSQNGEVPQESNVSIRKSGKVITYGFKIEDDYNKFKDYVSGKYEFRTSDSKGSRYPYHVIIN